MGRQAEASVVQVTAMKFELIVENEEWTLWRIGHWVHGHHKATGEHWWAYDSEFDRYSSDWPETVPWSSKFKWKYYG